MSEVFRIRPGVLELIAGIALLELEGGNGIGLRPDHFEDRLKKKNLVKGVKATTVEENAVSLQIELNLDYGQNLKKVAGEAQRLVKEAVESMTGYRVDQVNVYLVGVNPV